MQVRKELLDVECCFTFSKTMLITFENIIDNLSHCKISVFSFKPILHSSLDSMWNIRFTFSFTSLQWTVATISPLSSFTGVGIGGGVSQSERFSWNQLLNSWSPISSENSPGAAFSCCQVRVGWGFNPPQQFLLNGDNESNHPIWGWWVRGCPLIRLLWKDLNKN